MQGELETQLWNCTTMEIVVPQKQEEVWGRDLALRAVRIRMLCILFLTGSNGHCIQLALSDYNQRVSSFFVFELFNLLYPIYSVRNWDLPLMAW